MSNRWEIEESLSADDWTLAKFTACEENGSKTLSGLQFILGSESLGLEITLSKIGNVRDGKCRTLTLSGELTSVEASYDTFLGRVTKIVFVKGPTKASFGTGDSNKKTWYFSGSNRLAGLFGTVSDAGITSLGFVTIDQTCPALVQEEEQQQDQQQGKDEGLIGWWKSLDPVIQIAIIVLPICLLVIVIKAIQMIRNRRKRDMRLHNQQEKYK